MEIVITSKNNEKIMLDGVTNILNLKHINCIYVGNFQGIVYLCSLIGSAILTTYFEYNNSKITNEHVHVSDVS